MYIADSNSGSRDITVEAKIMFFKGSNHTKVTRKILKT